MSVTAVGISMHNAAMLVEEGPQVMRSDIPESVGRMRDGTVRMGYQALPADYAYVEYVQSRVARIREGVTFLGHEVDIWG